MTEPLITHERVDDIPLLLHVLRQRLELDQILDEQLARHGNWQGLSVGGVTVTWLTHILTECDHFMSHVQDWAKARPETLGHLLGQPIRDTDLTDDRLSEVARHLSDDTLWHRVESATNARMIRAYRLPRRRVRVDSTTAKIDKEGVSWLFRRGHSKDHRPDLPQLKVMLASLDPLGVLVAADVVAGNVADDPLYLPIIDRLCDDWQTKGLLFVGDCKLASLANRTQIHQRGHFYLAPLAQVGEVPDQLAGWVQKALDGDVRLLPLKADDGTRWGEGYEITRRLTRPTDAGVAVCWKERVWIVCSQSLRDTQQRGLRQRLEHAEAALRALTPPRGRGQRQFTEAEPLRAAVEQLLTHYQVHGLLTVRIKEEVERRTVRAYGNQPAHVTEQRRYVVQVWRNPAAIEQHEHTLGWRAYVTNAPRRQLSMEQGIQCYADEYLVERNCHRLKGRPLSLSPLWVTREDHAVGLTRLLTLAARVLAVVEYEVRQQLKAQKETLTGLFPGQATRETATPTTERLLKAFDNIALIVIRKGDHVERHLTTLSALQKTILRLLKCPISWYQQLTLDSG
jgi:transposase